jgi:hypothetical protein
VPISHLPTPSERFARSTTWQILCNAPFADLPSGDNETRNSSPVWTPQEVFRLSMPTAHTGVIDLAAVEAARRRPDIPPSVPTVASTPWSRSSRAGTVRSTVGAASIHAAAAELYGTTQ